MNHHLETLGLAVAYADLDLIPLSIRWSYEGGATPNEVRAAIEGGFRLADVPAAVRAMALELAHTWAGLRAGDRPPSGECPSRGAPGAWSGRRQPTG